MSTNKYVYKPYNPLAPVKAAAEQKRLYLHLSPSAHIEHFGSSAIPGMGGKGIIDLYICVAETEKKQTTEILQEKLGYELRPNGGDDRRLFFVRQSEDTEKNTWTYHLHLTDTENPNYAQSLAFRDYLRSHPEEATQYAQVKQRASHFALQNNDHESQKKTYQQEKMACIQELTAKAVEWVKRKSE